MPIPSINSLAKVNPADIPLEKLATSKALTEEQKTSEMTRQFEAMLMRQILTEAQKPMFKSNLASGGGVSTAIYQDLMVTQLADKISSSRTVGLAQELEKQVSRQSHPKPAQAASAGAADISQNNKNQAPPIPLTKAPRL